MRDEEGGAAAKWFAEILLVAYSCCWWGIEWARREGLAVKVFVAEDLNCGLPIDMSSSELLSKEMPLLPLVPLLLKGPSCG